MSPRALCTYLCIGGPGVAECGPMRYLRILYAMGCSIWAAYIIRILAPFHIAHPEAKLSGAVYCVLLLAVLPSVLGYMTLFVGVPRISRHLRR